MINSLRKYIQEKNWDKISAIPSEELAKSLPFYDGIRFAYIILVKGFEEWDMREYSVQLLNAVRNHYPAEWNSSWKYDAFLGAVCDDAYDYDGRYEAYKRAYERAEDPKPPRLLIQLAGCAHAPGEPPISVEEAMELLKQAMKEKPFADGIGVMRTITFGKGNEKQEAELAKLYEELEKKKQYSPSIDLEFINESLLENF